MTLRRSMSVRVAGTIAVLVVGAAVAAVPAEGAGAAPVPYSVTSSVALPGVPLFAAADGTLGKVYTTDGQQYLTSVDTTHGNTADRAQVNYSYGVATDESTHRVYVADYNESSVAVVDGVSGQRIATIAVTGTPYAIAVDPVRHLVDIGSFGDSHTGCETGAGNCPGFVSVIDATTNTVVRTVALSGGGGPVTVDPTTHLVYTTDTDTVTVIDEISGSVIGTIGVPQAGWLVADPTHGRIYVGSGSSLAIVNEARRKVVGTIALAGSAGQLGVDPSRQVAYVAVHDDADATAALSVVDLSDDSVSDVVPLGQGVALGVAVDTTAHAAYVGYYTGLEAGRFDVVTQAVRTNVTQVSPADGPTAGGQPVTLTGEHFTGATRVTFGNVSAPSFHVDSDGQITAVSPPHAAGHVFVRVRTPAGGQSAKRRENRYTYTVG